MNTQLSLSNENIESVEGRINSLEKVEQKIISLMGFMASSFEELAKDKPIGRHFDTNVQNVKNSLCELERDINVQINYINKASAS
ncbi:hypothetical protein Ciccas_003446 [Cichlidogyrus casuarinus]|uniref:Uncharacterized protein n=1 Tax=Cichlidogyrus casuarinus TaxID=1844966 RepID=A0ABD2QEA5_9PLAT